MAVGGRKDRKKRKMCEKKEGRATGRTMNLTGRRDEIGRLTGEIVRAASGQKRRRESSPQGGRFIRPPTNGGHSSTPTKQETKKKKSITTRQETKKRTMENNGLSAREPGEGEVEKVRVCELTERGVLKWKG